MRKPLRDYRAGDAIDDVFINGGSEVKTSDRAKDWWLLKIVVCDAFGSMTAVVKKPSDSDIKALPGWPTIRVTGKVVPDKFGGEGALQIEAAWFGPETPATMEGLEAIGAKSIGDYRLELDELISMAREPLRSVLDLVFSGPDFEAFCALPAAAHIHHAHKGGLLQHTIEVARLAFAMCETWQTILSRPVNRDLVIAGALLHDIGKLDELDGDVFPAGYTIDALVGHCAAGISRVVQAVGELRRRGHDFPNDIAVQLLHIIISHHGKMEHGAAVEPRTAEARIVSDADGQSAWVQIYHETNDKATGMKLFEKTAVGGRVLISRAMAAEAEAATDLPAQPTLFDVFAQKRGSVAVTAADTESEPDAFDYAANGAPALRENSI